MPPARKLSVTDTTGCSCRSTTTSCSPFASPASANGGKRAGESGVGLGGLVGNPWADKTTEGRKDGRTESKTTATASFRSTETTFRLSVIPSFRRLRCPRMQQHDHRIRRVEVLL